LEKLKKTEEMIFWILKKDANQQQEQVQEFQIQYLFQNLSNCLQFFFGNQKMINSYIFYKRYCKNLAKRKKELYLEMILEKSGASKRGDLFKLIKSGNRKKKTCFLNPKNMQEHTGYFLQTFGKLPQGDSSVFDSEILESSNPKETN
jgi:hypothetical protein